MFDAASRNVPPFRRDDLFWFGERDADELDWQYLKPDYWLYFPTDRRAPFLSAEPDCRKDYLSAFLGRLVGSLALSSNGIAADWELPGRARPASSVTVRLKLKPTVQAEGVTFLVGGKVATHASFNCISNVAVSQIRLPEEPGDLEVAALVSTAVGAEPIRIGLGRIELSPTADGTAAADVPRVQPTVKEVLSHFPKLRIERFRVTENPWDGFVLIDLRHIHGKRGPGTYAECLEDRTAGAACAK